MKVLLVSHSNFLGGAELCFLEMIEALRLKDNYEIHAVFPAHKGALKQLCEPLCNETYTRFLPYWINRTPKYTLKEKIKHFLSIISSTNKARKLIKSVAPDVVITNTSVIPQFALASKLTGNKHVCFIHELVDEDFGCLFTFGKSFSKKMIAFCSDFVITNSNFVNSRYIPYVNKRKLDVLYQPVVIGLDTSLPDERNSPVLTLLIMGKIAEFKGQREAILACKELAERNVNFKLFIVGFYDESYKEELDKIVGAYNLENKIEFIPFTDTPSEYYKQADIVLVCSRCEALGRITIEAMKMGLPVVASNRGGNLELVKDDFNGYIYQFGEPKDLADKILQLEDVDYRIQLGKNGKKWATENFNLEKFSDNLNRILSNL